MSVAGDLDDIALALSRLGFPGGDTQTADVLGVNHTTVWRWRVGVAQPRGKQRKALALLLACARRGSRSSERALRAFASCPGLARLGHVGLLKALGFGWALKGGDL